MEIYQAWRNNEKCGRRIKWVEGKIEKNVCDVLHIRRGAVVCSLILGYGRRNSKNKSVEPKKFIQDLKSIQVKQSTGADKISFRIKSYGTTKDGDVLKRIR